MVQRPLLLQKLRTRGVSEALAQTLHSVLQGTKADIDGEKIAMDIGVPQGAVLSPTLFALYIDDLLTQLNEGTECYTFADDLVIVAKGPIKLTLAIDKIEAWSAANGIAVNRAKSGVMQVRMDRRTPAPWEAQIRGFPVVKTYRYLGVLFDDSLSLEQELKKKKELERSLRTQMQRMNYMQLEPAARYHVWQALMKSRLWYSIVLTSRISPKVKTWM